MEDLPENQDFDEDNYYPNWLGQSLVLDDFPWDQSTAYTVQEFLAKYTLHDSHWVNIYHEVANNNDATLVLMWDEVWLPKQILVFSQV